LRVGFARLVSKATVVAKAEPVGRREQPTRRAPAVIDEDSDGSGGRILAMRKWLGPVRP
jgi:hypothetical protein